MLWLVALGGAAGSVARVLAGGALNGPGAVLPYGTLAVNLAGSFLIGVVLRWSETLGAAGNAPRALLAAGFCGGFTTFSAFSAETLALLQRGDLGRAALYATLSLLGCLAATAAGLTLARRLAAAA